MNIHFVNDKPNLTLSYSVILPRVKNQWVLCRHKQRHTWEFPGGHIEPGETPQQAAQRELAEETGLLQQVVFLCYYIVVSDDNDITAGCLYFAEVESLEKVPAEFEMAETKLFTCLPENLTYPTIQIAMEDYWKTKKT